MNKDIFDLKSNISNIIDFENNTIVYQDFKGKVYKEDLINDTVLWSYKGEELNMPSLAHLKIEKEIFLTSPKAVLKLNNNDGRLVSSLSDLIVGRTTNLAHQDDLIIASSLKGIYSFKINGNKLQYQLDSFKNSGTTNNSSFVTDDEFLYVLGLGDSLSYSHNNLLKLKKDSGQLIISKRINCDYFLGLTSSNTNIYCALKKNNDYIVNSYNKENLELSWSNKYENKLINDILFFNDYVYVLSNDEIFCLSGKTGILKYENKIPPFSRVIKINKETIYLGNYKGIIRYKLSKTGLFEAKIIHGENNGFWEINNFIFVSEENKLYKYSSSNGASMSK
ncbi:hypothetical protein [Tenacibaculum sp. MAR_2009_124]|uniref:hypothetical protein n=1 Tax=Tenacibaculum sp. MAR_2009_124 TaxID=1250059 RepID=UPI00115F7D09|nr:hypothetical protein [Tenacibaculum sp. MAR_2009_124]